MIGLDAFIDCPEDPKCPALTTGTGGATTTTTTTPSNTGGSIPAPACDDTVKNGTETDIDCGGSCPADCADGLGCDNGGDCVSKLCTGGTCVAASCTDGVSNGDETDKDCGGTCPPCAFAQACVVDGDCEGGLCTSGKCAATCTDGLKNGDESDEDCGGATCPKCLIDKQCATGPDCETGVCQAAKCVSYHVWQKQFGDSDYQGPRGVATDQLGNVYLAADLAGTTNFGGSNLTIPVAVGTSFGIAKFDPAGNHVWSKAFPTAVASASGIAVDPQGNVTVAGSAETGVDLGGGPLTTTSSLTTFIARYDTGGNHLFSKLVPNAYTATVTAGSARYAVAGSANKNNTINYGCGSLAPKGLTDAVIGVFHPANGCAWSKRFGIANGVIFATAAAADVDSNIIVAFELQSVGPTMDLGCGPLSTPTNTGGILAKFDEITGACVWNVAFGNFSNGTNSLVDIQGLGVDGFGKVTIAGRHSGQFDIGTESFITPGFAQMFVAQFDQAGSFTWAKDFPNSMGSGLFVTLAVSPGGKIAVAGATMAGTDLGGGPLPETGPFLVEFDPVGQHLWSHGFPTVLPPSTPFAGLSNVAYGTENEVIVTASFDGKIDFGIGPMTTKGSADVALAKLLIP